MASKPSSKFKNIFKRKYKETNTTSDRAKERKKERTQLREEEKYKRRHISREASLVDDNLAIDGDILQPLPLSLVTRYKKAETKSERLKKWKQEKQKKQEAQKASKKPIFKHGSNLLSYGNSDLLVRKKFSAKTPSSKELLKINPTVEQEIKEAISKPVVPVIRSSSTKQIGSAAYNYTKLTEAAKAKINQGKKHTFLKAKSNAPIETAKTEKDKIAGLQLSDDFFTPKHSTLRKIKYSCNPSTCVSAKSCNPSTCVSAKSCNPSTCVSAKSCNPSTCVSAKCKKTCECLPDINISAVIRSPKALECKGSNRRSKRKSSCSVVGSVSDEGTTDTSWEFYQPRPKKSMTTPQPTKKILVVDSPGNVQNPTMITFSQRINYKNSCDKVTLKAANPQECTFAEENDENVDVANPQKCPKSLVTMLFDDKSEHNSPAKRPRRSVVQKLVNECLLINKDILTLI